MLDPYIYKQIGPYLGGPLKMPSYACRSMVSFYSFRLRALEELPLQDNTEDLDDRSPDVELPIYQQRDNFFT
ncbi:unnamed protein product [Parnassius apollo]|uniref:(apollo) hypothetical protein n=1 Tax=Parnassius apollo TaxID=110799 RepID=A0A8S3WMY9_PARAO|nr:unnamed protein product [Parnassius apollo]